MENETLKQWLSHLETPAYIFHETSFTKRSNLVRDAFGEKVGLCFSIKANPFLLTCLPQVFDKIEVCSPGELTICEKTGIDMSKVIFSGVNKTLPDVQRAMDDKVGVFTAESRLHLELINQCALERGIIVPVLLRLTGGSQFGMDETDFMDLIAHRDQYLGVEVVGMHYFTGTQKKKVSTIEKELVYIERFADQINQELGFKIRKIEYGTGLAVEYFSETAEAIEQERLWNVAPAIRALGEKYDLTIEMGRFFAAPCGYYFTKVMDIKTNCGVNYAIVDGGMNQLKYDGQLQGMQIPMIQHLTERTQKEDSPEKWTLCGSLCTTADVLARNVELTDLQLGDVLVFERTGAYSAMEGMATFLSREMPQIALCRDTQRIDIVRQIIKTDVFNTGEDKTF